MIALTFSVGVLALFVGIAMLAPRLVKPLASLVGAPAARLGGAPGRLARENSLRNPGRTASTAAALMIGLALVTVVATLGAGLRGSTETAVKKQVEADYVVTAKDGGGSFTGRLRRGVRLSATASRSSPACAPTPAWSPATSRPSAASTRRRSTTSTTTSGSRARSPGSTQGGALVTKSFAEGHDLKVGSPLVVQSSSGQKLKLHVVGIHEPPAMDSLLGDVAIAQKAFDGAFARPQNAFTFVDGSSKAALAGAMASYPDAKLTTQAEFVESRADGLKMILKHALRPARLLAWSSASSAWSTRSCSPSTSARVSSGCCARSA